MKKILVLAITFLLFLAGCGTDSDVDSDSQDETSNSTVEVNDSKNGEHAYHPHEPTEDTVCHACNMKVYTRDESLGVFTAQGVTKDGENVFFDDIGCILNFERKNGEELAIQWIRDYLTKDWVELEGATPVKTNIVSPMKYGYIFFEEKDTAEQFVTAEENSDLDPSIVDWTEIDEEANDRFQKKMKAQMEGKK